jgi:hypothetical protein
LNALTVNAAIATASKFRFAALVAGESGSADAAKMPCRFPRARPIAAFGNFFKDG